MAHSESVHQGRRTTWSTTPPAGIVGMLAAPAIHRDTLLAALADLPPSGVAPLLERLSYHRVDGLAFRALSRLPKEAVDPWLRATLKRRHQRCAAATLVQGMAMAEMLEHLSCNGVRVAVMGGLRSVESIHGDAGSLSIDVHHLLVLPDDRPMAATILRRNGLEPAGGNGFRRGGLLVDLHSDAIDARRRPRKPLFPLPTEGLMNRATPGRVAGAPAMLLSPEDELLLLAVDAIRRTFGRMIGVADLAHLIAAQGCALDWSAIRTRAADSHTTRLLDLALNLITLLGVAPPWEVKPGGPGRWLEHFLVHRSRPFPSLPLGGEILVALTAPGLSGVLGCLVDALLPISRRGVAQRRPHSNDERRGVVAFRPGANRERHTEESLHGR